MKFDIWVFFTNLSRKFKFRWNLTRIVGTLHEDLCTFMIIPRWILLRIKSVSDRSCRGNQNTHIMINNFFFENRVVYEIMWKNIVQPDRPQMTTQYGTCALHAGQLRLQTHSEYVILIAFPRQEWLHERASILRCTYFAVLFMFRFVLEPRICVCFSWNEPTVLADSARCGSCLKLLLTRPDFPSIIVYVV
jgi:hypothetical protein